jgi:hypothetical protein
VGAQQSINPFTQRRVAGTSGVQVRGALCWARLLQGGASADGADLSRVNRSPSPSAPCQNSRHQAVQSRKLGYNACHGDTAMPMHDWTRVTAGTYHNFHFRWIAAIMDRLNAGLLPPGFFAMAEQIIGRPETDVVTLQTKPLPKGEGVRNGGVAIATPQPKTRFVLALESERYARKANRIAVHHELGEVVAVIEIISPGNKDRRHSMQSFVTKAVDLIEQRVNLLIIDPFPPGTHDPRGVAGAVLDELGSQRFELPPDKPLTLSAYQVEPIEMAYIETVAVGDRLPDMPLFLYDAHHIYVPLEATYQTTWSVLPAEIRDLLEPLAKF